MIRKLVSTVAKQCIAVLYVFIYDNSIYVMNLIQKVIVWQVNEFTMAVFSTTPAIRLTLKGAELVLGAYRNFI